MRRSQLLQFSSPVSARLLQFCSPVSVPPRECTRVEQTRFVFLSFFGFLIFVNRFQSRLPGYILSNTCIMLHDYVLHPNVFSFSGSPSSYARKKNMSEKLVSARIFCSFSFPFPPPIFALQYSTRVSALYSAMGWLASC